MRTQEIRTVPKSRLSPGLKYLWKCLNPVVGTYAASTVRDGAVLLPLMP